MKKRPGGCQRTILAFLLAFFLLSGVSPAANAQSPTLTLGITYPSEGETFYAGPPALQYNLRISGWVVSTRYKPAQLDIQVNIIKGEDVIGEFHSHPQPDGSYQVFATVNPDADSGHVLVHPEHDSCPTCHFRGDLDLPGGSSIVRVTVTDPGKNKAVAERRIAVDRAGFAIVPVQIVDEGHSNQPIANVRVTGSTWLYLWRSRSSSSFSDARGRANLQIEVLAQVPTDYVFRVEPTIVDGVLYEGIEPITITLPSGAASAPGITLKVRGRTGQIIGKLVGAGLPFAPVPIRAIDVRNGVSYAAQSTTEGTFAFSILPIGRYLVAADTPTLLARGYSSANQTIDLVQSPSADASLPLHPVEANRLIRLTLRDKKSSDALPFGWVTNEKAALASSVEPKAGSYSTGDLPPEPLTVVASAPGYYSQAQVVSFPAMDFYLTRRPETRNIAWGNGEILIPPESQASIEPNRIVLNYGWLWGKGSEGTLTVLLPDAEITIQSARFAIEYLPARSAWLYVMEGSALLRTRNSAESTAIRAGEMTALGKGSRFIAATQEPGVFENLHTASALPLSPVWEATPEAQIRDRFAQMGIGAGQFTTFVTYMFVVAVIAIAPLVALHWWMKKI